MNDSTDMPERDELEDARQIEHWVRSYAQNRSLPVLVGLVVFTLLSLAISLPSYWGGIAYREGDTTRFAICVVLVIVALVATVFFAVPRWGFRRLQQMGQALYAQEGNATISTPRARRSWLGLAIGVAFGICVQVQVILGLLGYLPDDKYMQPISALYCVPFLVAVNFLLRPATGYIPLLWPFLYAVHAVLIVVGVPIVFTGAWDSLNMLIPTVGYGMLVSLIGHLYSRWALHNVRTIVSRQLDNADLIPNGEQV